MEEKRCGKCSEYKSINEFHRRGNGYQSVCKSCRKLIDSATYKENFEKVKERTKSRKSEERKINKLKVYQYLSEHPCVDCGESDPIVLEFDHLRDKEYSVSRMLNTNLGWNRIKKEIDKCEVRCANCHRRKTAKQFKWFTWSEVDSSE